MTERHVVANETGWQVEKQDAERPSARVATQAEGVHRATEIVVHAGGGTVVVHATDGTVVGRHAVDAHADVDAEAARITAAATAESARELGSTVSEEAEATARAVSGEVSETRDDVAEETRAVADRAATTSRVAGAAIAGEARDALDPNHPRDARTAADSAATIARETGRGIGQDVAGTARVVEDQVDRAAGRVRSEVGESLDAAGDATVAAGDRADTVSSGVATEIDDTAHRVAAQVGAVSERAAARLDARVDAGVDAVASEIHRVVPLVNPLRIAGRGTQLVVRIVLGSTGAVVSTTGQVLSRGARSVTGR